MNMTAQKIVQLAIPNVLDAIVDHILWGMTSFPFQVSAKDIYRAASRFKRASQNGIQLCDFCDNKAIEHKCICKKCLGCIKPVTQPQRDLFTND